MEMCARCEREFNMKEFLDEEGLFSSPTETCAYCDEIFCVSGSDNSCFELHECAGHNPFKYHCSNCGANVDILEKGSESCLVCEAKSIFV